MRCRIISEVFRLIELNQFLSFVYAGWDTVFGPSSIPLDTINILTLPAFHWISVPYNPQNPRHGLSCNAVGGSQILTIGGVDTNANPTDGAPDAAKKSAFDSAPDPFAQGLAIFDMTTLKFSDQYTAGAPPYEQSQAVKQFYSQSQEQAATKARLIIKQLTVS